MSDRIKLCEITIKAGVIADYFGIQPEYLQFILTGDDSLIINGSGEDKPLGVLIDEEGKDVKT